MSPATSLPRIRLLHTSDVHIGDEGARELRLRGLERAIDAALAHAVDCVLIAGDLFDSARVCQEDIDAALAQLARLCAPVVVTPGNHDCLEPPSIYQRVRLRDAGAHVHFAADPAGAHVRLEELRLAIWARALHAHLPVHRPLANYAPCPGDWWQVALAHGHWVEDERDAHRSSPIRSAEIAALRCDYLALGHWHRFADLSAGGVLACYSGSPSDCGSARPSANLVILAPGRPAQVERLDLVLE
jgi:DNA repair exonuclease SbcCD nuclease subunit